MDTTRTKRLNVTINCQAVYNSAIQVPADMSLDEAIAYTKEHLQDIPLTTLEYVKFSDELDEDNCSFDD